jgi:NADPH-dependent curcumin reductase
MHDAKRRRGAGLQARAPSPTRTGELTAYSRRMGAEPSATNRQVRLAARPSGLPKSSDWSLVEEPVPTPGNGEFVVRVSHISLDPAMRGWMNAGASYIDPVEVGEVMRAGCIGRVSASAHPGFPVGEHVYGTFGVQEHALSDGKGAVKVDPSLAPLETYLGALGMTGLTAYFGMLDVAKVQDGDTVVVSGAAGAVGSVAGQIGKLKGARVIGIAGGAEKCRWLVEDLGFDAAIDYKSEDVRRTLRTLAPKGVDVFFDNVGGEILDAVLTRLARGARIVICGAVSQYNNAGPVRGPSNYLSLLVFRATMTGMVVFDYAARYGEATAELAGWMREGLIASREHLVDGGVEDFHDTLLGLFEGANVGKLVLRLDDA